MKAIKLRRTPAFVAIQLLLASTSAFAADYTGTQKADGTHLDLSDSTVTTSNYLEYGVHAINGGSVSAANLDIATGGAAAYGLHIDSGNSRIDFSAGSIATTGDQAIAVRAVGPGTINLDASQITTSGTSSWGVLAMGNGANVHVNGGSITTTGADGTGVVGYNGGYVSVGRDGSGQGAIINVSGNGARGVRADNGVVDVDGATINVTGKIGTGSPQTGLSSIANGTLNAKNTTIDVTQDAGIGTSAGTNSFLSLSDSSITTAGKNGYGVRGATGSTTILDNTAVSTAGQSAHGALVTDAGSTIAIRNSAIATTGLGAYGAAATDGGHLELTDTTISTTAFQGYGVSANGSAADGTASTAIITNGSITTDGIQAHGVLAQSSAQVAINGASIATSAEQARGLLVQSGSRIDATNTNIVTQGRNQAHGAEATGAGTVLTLTGGSIQLNAGADSSHAVYVNDGAAALVDAVSIYTTGTYSNGVFANNGSNVVVRNSAIKADGSTMHGIDARNGSYINASNTSIALHGNGSSGLFVNEGGLLDASGMTIATSGENSSAVLMGTGQIAVANSNLSTSGQRSIGARNTGGTLQLSGTTIQTTGAQSHGLVSENAGSITAMHGGNILTQGAQAKGAVASGADNALTLNGVTVRTEGAGSTGLQVSNGATLLANGTVIRTSGENAYGAAVAANVGGSAALQLSNTDLASTASAFTVSGAGESSIALSNTRAVGNGGLLLTDVADSSGNTSTGTGTFNASQSFLQGDIEVSDSYRQNVALTSGTQWAGSAHGLDNLTLDNSQWNMTASSAVNALSLNQSAIAMAAPVDGVFKTLHVAGDMSGTGGVVQMNTVLNEGGTLAKQQTDRLLVGGNVTTNGTTLLDVKPQGGIGALTDTNKNGIIEANEGISLAQVAGTSRADAFALKGGYVAAGPYQYGLYAFGPGQTDAAQNALPSGDLNWDYRLGNKFVDEGGDVGPGDPIDPGTDRPAVVPQVPSYIVAPTALFNYGNTIIDTLHQRLGEIRQVAGKDDDRLGGEVFVRYIGSQQSYSSDRSFTNYGYGFDQQINALQLGGSILGWTGDKSSLRAGWAVDKGTTRVTPKAVDGFSNGKYDAYGVSAWLTWQQDNGFYIDAMVGGQRYNGDIGSASRGNVGQVRASSANASIETGYPIAVGGGWSIEPQAQLKYQHLSFGGIHDVDDLATTISPSGQTTARLGARLVKSDNAKFAPYARFDVLRTLGGAAKVTTSSEAWGISDTFQAGQVGTGYRAGLGMTSALTKNLSIYGEADYLRGASDQGFKGWTGNIGLRFNF